MGRRDRFTSTGLNNHAVERGLRGLSLLFQGLDTLLGVGVELDDPLLDRPVEALESIVAARDFGMEGCLALLDCLIFRSLPFDQCFQDPGQPVTAE